MQYDSAWLFSPDQAAVFPWVCASIIKRSAFSLVRENTFCKTLDTYSIVFTGSSHKSTSHGVATSDSVTDRVSVAVLDMSP